MTAPQTLERLIGERLAELTGLYRLADGRRGSDEPLTAVELRMAAMVAAGRTNKQIAAEAHYSEDGVKNVLRGVFRKLGVDRRSQVAGALAAAGGGV